MDFKIFNNEILAPLKCGSTYLKMVYPNDIKNADYHTLHTFDKISTIIIREPFEHLQSALHTEILMWYMLNPSESLSVDTATPLIKRFINSDSNKVGTTHWDVNYYEHFYKFWKDNKDSIKIVDTSNLTEFLKEEYGIDVPHDKFSYGITKHSGKFKYAYTTKEKLSKWIEIELPKLWSDLTEELPKANRFYNFMINGEISEIYELENQISELKYYTDSFKNQISKMENQISKMENQISELKYYTHGLENQISELRKWDKISLDKKII